LAWPGRLGRLAVDLPVSLARRERPSPARRAGSRSCRGLLRRLEVLDRRAGARVRPIGGCYRACPRCVAAGGAARRAVARRRRHAGRACGHAGRHEQRRAAHEHGQRKREPWPRRAANGRTGQGHQLHRTTDGTRAGAPVTALRKSESGWYRWRLVQSGADRSRRPNDAASASPRTRRGRPTADPPPTTTILIVCASLVHALLNTIWR
jgi:hypothetical protein